MLKLISANIEGDRHRAAVVPFFREQRPNVACIQEVFLHDLPELLGDDVAFEFLPMCLKIDRNGSLSPWGAAVSCRFPIEGVRSAYYHQPTDDLARYDPQNKRQTIRHGILGLRFTAMGKPFNVITTHFTWTPNGEPDVNQDQDITAMLDLLEQEPPHILCGDFNIPRGYNHHYDTLRQRYTDNVPDSISSSIYVPLHYASAKPETAEKLSRFMVDYIFSTPKAYRVENVERHGGLSDHYLFTATIAAL
jgi:endonuclease/exonuclease/phosphatase family metal-dependent hydrolase